MVSEPQVESNYQFALMLFSHEMSRLGQQSRKIFLKKKNSQPNYKTNVASIRLLVCWHGYSKLTCSTINILKGTSLDFKLIF